MSGSYQHIWALFVAVSCFLTLCQLELVVTFPMAHFHMTIRKLHFPWTVSLGETWIKENKINLCFMVMETPKEEKLPYSYTCSLHLKGKAKEIYLQQPKQIISLGELCQVCSVCSPTCLWLCLKHSINDSGTPPAKLMSNINFALDLETRLHTGVFKPSSITHAKTIYLWKWLTREPILGSLETFLYLILKLLKPRKAECHLKNK